MTLASLSQSLSDRYRLERELGAGGMATVYLARDLKHDRNVAIKVLHPDLAAAVGTQRFTREIQLAAKLSHPHILPLFDSGVAGELPWYAMPVVQGASLRERLDRDGRLPVAEAVRVAREVASALAYAHEVGIVHRDIKPENILLQHGHALLADFGIGKAMAEAGDSAMTQTGMSVGTPAYMAPEQAAGEAVDGRSDLYALGCVLYECLVGEPPFTGPNVQAVIAKRFIQTPADVTALREGVPRWLGQAVRSALQRTPIDRPTAAEWVVSLAGDEGAGATSTPERSIAVLPFENLSADRDNEFFGDGISDDIIEALSRVQGLHVAARMSAFSFRGRQVELRTVGEALNVAMVLQGSVRRAGNRVRITAQLMTVADNYQLWSERYDREMVDVFAVQDEIAQSIAERLRLTLEPPERAQARATTRDMEAYELMAKARAHIMQRGAALYPAIETLERVLELQPRNAEAWALLGSARRLLINYDRGDVWERLTGSREAHERALAIDPENATAIAGLAMIAVMEDVTRRNEARRLFERALALDPRLSEVRSLYASWGLLFLGDGSDDEAATRELRRASDDDPRNPICSAIHAAIGIIGEHDEAIRIARAGVSNDPSAFAPRWGLGVALVFGQRIDDGIPEMQGALDRFGRHPLLLWTLGALYSLGGDRRRAEAVHAELTARLETGHVTAFAMAMSAAYLQRDDEAVEWAIRSARQRDALGPMWFRWRGIDCIQQHPRFIEVVESLGGWPTGRPWTWGRR